MITIGRATGILVLLAFSLLPGTSGWAAASHPAALVAGTPITMVAYQRRLRLLHALPLMNDPLRTPVPPVDAAIEQLIAVRVMTLEGERLHIRPTAAALRQAAALQRAEYRTVGGVGALERRGLLSPAEVQDEVRVTALGITLDQHLGAGWYDRAFARDHVVYYVGSQALDTPAAVVGHPAPNVTLRTLDGRMASIAGLRGRPTILNIWATWCRWCGRELPMIATFASAHPALRFVAVEEHGTASLVQTYLRAHSVHPPVLFDPAGTLSQVYNIDLLPTTLALDAHGRIRAIERGYLRGTDDLLRLARAAQEDGP